jgi:hypothetical protein
MKQGKSRNAVDYCQPPSNFQLVSFRGFELAQRIVEKRSDFSVACGIRVNTVKVVLSELEVHKRPVGDLTEHLYACAAKANVKSSRGVLSELRGALV